ncbi:MAG: DUF2703 domain-containing protein, partial [Mailhella sp.]|nr:DUF2703 domain-containing protein [Mailhella sp.]
MIELKRMEQCLLSGENNKIKKIKIEYLYLDLNTCDRCVGTDAVLEEVIDVLAQVFDIAGYSLEYNKIEIRTEKDAVENRFVSSPTVRVNGIDICDEVKESDCGCCGEISGTQVDCRIFEYEGRLYEVPPKAMLAESILKLAVKSPKASCCESYALPENLKNFFEGKSKKEVC